MLLETKKLTFGYIKKPLLFSGVNLSIDSGVLFVTGMEGAGKSTLLKTLCDMQDMYLGEVFVCGKRPKDSTNNITYLPAEPIFLNGKSVLDNLKFASCAIGREYSEEKSDDWLQQRLKTKVKKLSKLDKYILALKRAEIKQAKLVLLDLSFDNLSTEEISEYKIELNKLFSQKDRLFVVAISAKDFKKLNYSANNAKFLHIFMGKTNIFNNFAEFTAKITDSSMAEYINLLKYKGEIISNENGYFLKVAEKVLKIDEKYIKGIMPYFEVSSEAKIDIFAAESIDDLNEKQFAEGLENKSILMFDEISYEILF